MLSFYSGRNRTCQGGRIGLFLLTTSLWLRVTGAVWADEKPVIHNDRPLHELIDEHIESGWTAKSVQAAEMASDAAFLRRVTLDLTGVVPTSDDARAFLNDDSPNKRQRLIDQLLDSPEYSLHMARVMDVMLTERRIATIRSYDVSTTNWREYLAASFAENKPWDQLVREILSGDGTDTATGPAAKFYLSRDVKPDLLTRDVGRLFLQGNRMKFRQT